MNMYGPQERYQEEYYDQSSDDYRQEYQVQSHMDLITSRIFDRQSKNAFDAYGDPHYNQPAEDEDIFYDYYAHGDYENPYDDDYWFEQEDEYHDPYAEEMYEPHYEE